jgi:hypothetical protein
MTHQTLYDPQGHLAAELPLDPQARTRHVDLAQRALGWDTTTQLVPVPRDLELIALLLTGHARCVRDDVRRHSEDPGLPGAVRARLAGLADEGDRQLAVDAPAQGTLEHTRNRARLMLALYEGIDLAQSEEAAESPAPSAHP